MSREQDRPSTLRDWLAEHPPAPERFTQTLAAVARLTKEGEDFFRSVKEFLDEFSFRPSEIKNEAWLETPDATGDIRYDAYLGALAEHLAVREGLTPPAWSLDPARTLDRFWFPSPVEGFRAMAIVQSPAAFRRRGIFVAASSLTRR